GRVGRAQVDAEIEFSHCVSLGGPNEPARSLSIAERGLPSGVGPNAVDRVLDSRLIGSPHMPAYLERSVATYDGFPENSLWRKHVADGQPFVARGGMTSDLTLAVARKLGAKTRVTAINQADKTVAQVNLRDLIDGLGDPEARWYMKQQP